jgi:uncharacterized protein
MTPRISLLLCTSIILSACTQGKMVRTSGRVRNLTIQGNYAGALATLRQSKKDAFKEQDRVAFWMNEGMLLHLTKQYKASTDVLTKAEQRSKELFTKSVSKSISAAFTSDAATDYAGEDYENVLVNVVKSLNFLAQSNRESALVEARKINEKLSYYNTKYKHKNVYNQDAFALWLAGLLHEMGGEWDDARINYVKAMEVYKGAFAAYGIQAPSYLAEDAVRAALLSGDRGTAAKFKAMGADGHTVEAAKTQGEIVLVHLNGEGPSKSDYFINCIFKSILLWRCDGEPGGKFIKRTRITVTPNGWHSMKLAFPELHIHRPRSQSLSVSLGGITIRSEPAYPLSQIAAKTMRDKTARIFKDTIIRGVTKMLTVVAAEQVGKAAGSGGKKKNKKGGNLLGWLLKTATSTAMQATEEADKRAWTTLPARIDVARLWAPPGTHTITIRPSAGRAVTLPGVTVAAGKRTIITYRTIP